MSLGYWILIDCGRRFETYLVRYAPADTGDEDDTAAVPEADHLAACSLRCEQDTVDVDVHHLRENETRDKDKSVISPHRE